MSGFANVIVNRSVDDLDRIFTYRVPMGMDIPLGSQVRVPFGRQHITGFVISFSDKCDLPADKVRDIEGITSENAVILPELIRLADWMHSRYLCNLVDALRLMIPSELRSGRVRVRTQLQAHLLWNEDQIAEFANRNKRAQKQIELLRELQSGDRLCAELNSSALKSLREKGAIEIVDKELRRTPSALTKTDRSNDHELVPAQKRAVNAICGAMDAGEGNFLLNGVTGSGKTEVYIRSIRHALEKGKGAIVLVPEIALTPQMTSWFHARFGDNAAVLHSGLSAGERFDEWRRIRSGEARVVVGARSAVFAPIENLGIIIVDEEHENTYHSETRPCYDARDVARFRTDHSDAVLVLGSATPSIASFMKTASGVRPENKLTLLEMQERVNGKPMPEVEVVDMRGEFGKGNNSLFSARLTAEMHRCLSAGEQVMLLMNRRGHSSFVSCRKCGYVVKCSQCDVSMTYHQSNGLLMCHYCGNTQTPPRKCPECGSPYIKFFGAGTEKVEEEAQKLFPDARIVRMDLDTTRGKNAHEILLERFRSGEANILIGTQMIAKGLDFPNVTLVGIIAADMTLNLPDYRSTERTFQLLTQASGRAGRAEKTGRVIVQTYDPDHYAIKLAAAQDFRAFYHRESGFRRSALYPPFTQIVRLVCSGTDQKSVQAAAEDEETKLNKWIDAHGMRQDIVQMRALEAPISMLRGEYRWQVFLKMYFKGDFSAVCEYMQSLADAAPDNVRVSMEVNPINMY